MNYQLPVITNDITKSQIKIIAQDCIEQITANGNVLNAIDTLTKVEHLISEIKKDAGFVDYARTEIGKYGKEVTTPSGTKIEMIEAGVKYDFTKCDDEILNELLKSQEEIDNLVKERKDFLKKVPAGGMNIISIHKEVRMIYPPSKSSVSTFKTTLPK